MNFTRFLLPQDDIELGNGKKAGLASMETLDDSTRDSDAVDKSTPEKTEAKATDDEIPPLEKGPSVWETIGETIRAYSCSIGESIVCDRMQIKYA